MSLRLAAVAPLCLMLLACGSSNPVGPETVAANVLAAQQAQHGANAAVASQRSGYWRGTLTAGTSTMEVAGVATVQGLVLLHRVGLDSDAFVFRDLQTQAGRITGRLLHTRADGQQREYAFEGPADAGLLTGSLLPLGWTVAEYAARTRVPSPAETEQFGRVELRRVDPPAPLAQLTPGAWTWPTRSREAFTLDVASSGELSVQSASCSVEGGATASPSVGGLMELAGAARGGGCPAVGNFTGVISRNGQGELTLALTDGTRTSVTTIPSPTP